MNKLNALKELAAPDPNSSRTPDLLVVARALWAGKWQIAGLVALALALAAAHIATAKPKYIATTTLSLERPEREVVEFADSSGGPAAEEKKLETEAEVLKSRGLAEKLVEELSLLKDPEFNKTLQAPQFPSLAWAEMRVRELIGVGPAPVPDEQTVVSATIVQTLAAISVYTIPNTYLIELQVESNSPTKSASMANTLADLYIAARRNSRSDTDDQQIEWLSAQVDKLENALDSAERRQKELSVSTEVMSPEALEAQKQQLKALRERHSRTLSQTALADARIELLERLLNGATSDTISAVAADPTLSVVIGPGGNGPAGRQVDRARALRLLAAARAETERDGRLADTTAAAIADLEARIDRQSDEILEVRQIEREVEASATIYKFALDRLKQMQLERAIERPDASILSEAEPPLAPSGPNASVVAALAVALGSLLGAGLILVRKGLQDAFRTAEEIERISGVPVIGQIPTLPTSSRRKVMGHIVSDDSSSFSEAVRNLRASIISMSGNQPTVLMLSSAMPGEGKTTLAMALAHSLAAIDKRVLLIDADMRVGMLGKHFPKLKKTDGLASAIVDGKSLSELVVPSEALGVDILFSGRSPQNAADLFSSRDFRRILTEANNDYHFTIIDTPPTLVVSDAKLIAPHVDMVLLAVRWNKTSRSQFTDAVREILMSNTIVSGCILSLMDPKGMTKYGHGDRRGLVAGYRGGYYRE